MLYLNSATLTPSNKRLIKQVSGFSAAMTIILKPDIKVQSTRGDGTNYADYTTQS